MAKIYFVRSVPKDGYTAPVPMLYEAFFHGKKSKGLSFFPDVAKSHLVSERVVQMPQSQSFPVLAGEARNIRPNILPIHLLVEEEKYLSFCPGEKKIAWSASNKMAITRAQSPNWTGDAEETRILGDKSWFDQRGVSLFSWRLQGLPD